MNHSLKSRYGFNIIELLVVIGFSAIIASFAFFSLFGWREQKVVSATAQQMASTLREAESRAISQSKGTSWGVRFANDSKGGYFALFSTNTYSDSTRVGYYTLPNNVGYDIAKIPVGEYRDVIFEQVTGRPTVYMGPLDNSSPPTIGNVNNLSINISVRGRDTDKPSSSITVNTLGLISFDTFTCTITCFQTTNYFPPAPTLILTANPTSIIAGQSSTITWSATNANSCSAIWTASNGTSGSQIVTPPVTTTYDMTCIGDGGQTTQSVIVDVTAGGGGGGGGGKKK